LPEARRDVSALVALLSVGNAGLRRTMSRSSCHMSITIEKTERFVGAAHERAAILTPQRLPDPRRGEAGDMAAFARVIQKTEPQGAEFPRDVPIPTRTVQPDAARERAQVKSYRYGCRAKLQPSGLSDFVAEKLEVRDGRLRRRHPARLPADAGSVGGAGCGCSSCGAIGRVGTET